MVNYKDSWNEIQRLYAWAQRVASEQLPWQLKEKVEYLDSLKSSSQSILFIQQDFVPAGFPQTESAKVIQLGTYRSDSSFPEEQFHWHKTAPYSSLVRRSLTHDFLQAAKGHNVLSVNALIVTYEVVQKTVDTVQQWTMEPITVSENRYFATFQACQLRNRDDVIRGVEKHVQDELSDYLGKLKL